MTIESLPARWREEAATLDKSFSPGSGIMAAERRARADELEAALAAQPKDGELLALADGLRNGGLDKEPKDEFLRGLRAGKRQAADMIEALASRRVVVTEEMARRAKAAHDADVAKCKCDCQTTWPHMEVAIAAALQPDSGEG